MTILRDQFPVFKQLAYINSCSYGALAISVKKAMMQYLDDREQYGERWPHWVDQLELLRVKTASLLGAKPDEIALTASLSAGLNALVSSKLFSSAKNKVVCTAFDFPTTAQIWHAQAKRGAVVECVDTESAVEPDLAICAAIDAQTAVVSVPLICFRNGIKTRLDRIVSEARKHNALIVVDAYQAAGTMPLDVSKLDVDVLLGGYLKYLLGTSGMAYMYVSEKVRSHLDPASTGWFAQDDVHAMAIAANTPSASARKFEGGTPDISAIYACIAGLDIIADVGVTQIERTVAQLTGQLRDAANEEGWQLASGSRDYGPMLAIKSRAMYELVEKLRHEGIVVSCRDDNIRVSPHFYNNREDITALIEALRRHRDLLL